MVSRAPDSGGSWMGPVIAGSGFLVPIPVGLLLARPAGATIAVVVALLVGATLIAIGFRIVGRQEREKRQGSAGGRSHGGDGASGGPPHDELQARLAEVRQRNADD